MSTTKAKLIVFVVSTVASYALGWLDYLLNKRFILANIDALPWRYVIAKGFGTGTWWAIALSVLCGLLCVCYFWAQGMKERKY